MSEKLVKTLEKEKAARLNRAHEMFKDDEEFNRMNESVNEVKGLLMDHTSRDLEIYREMHLSTSFERTIDEKVQIMQDNLLRKEWGDATIVSEEEIERVAIKYNLRFLKTECYKGRITTDLAKKVSDYCAEHKIVFSPNTHNFRILAREEDFNLEDRPSPPPDPDPILFYRIKSDGGRTYWQIVHKWGADFSIWREITSWWMTAPWKVVFHLTFLSLLAIYALCTIIALTFGMSVEIWSAWRFWGSLTGAVIIALTSCMEEGSVARGFLTEKMWDSTYHRY